MQYTNSNFIQS